MKGPIVWLRQELRDLFSLKPEEVGASRTQADLSARHAAQRRTTPALDAHLAQLPRLPNYVGAPPSASRAAECCLMPAARHLLEERSAVLLAQGMTRMHADPQPGAHSAHCDEGCSVP